VAEPEPAPLANAPQEPASLRALLVEDNNINRTVALEFLQRAGCSVDSAVNGKEAVDLFQHRSYDIVLMDCQMPVMDGFAATVAMRNQERGARRTPIIALTANALAEERERCMNSGMDDFLVKPINQARLMAAIHRWVDAHVADTVAAE
jgi:CheY-like chemotaxis protein